MFSLLVRRCWCTCLMVDTVTVRRTVRRGGTNMTITKYDRTTPCYRCSDTSPETCTTAENNFMDLSDGIWSSNQDDNPFSDYFKVYIHYCTNDDYSGEFEAEDL